MIVMEMQALTGPLLGGVPISAWIDVVTFLVAIYVILRMNGGRLMYSVWLIGATGLVGFLALWLGGLPAMWVMSTIKSVVLLLAVVWFVIVFKT